MANDLVPYSQALSDPATTASSLESTDVIAIAREDSDRPTGFKSMVTRLLTLAKKIVSGIDYSSELTETDAKTITGAINEVAQNSGSVDITTAIDIPASVQTFNDGGDNIPLKSLVTEILPVQAGSGTPSPSNVRSISGFDSVDVVVTGDNILGGDKLLKNAQAYMVGGTTDTQAGTFIYSAGASITAGRTFSNDITFKENTQYTVIVSVKKNSGTSSNIRIVYTDDTYDNIEGATTSKSSLVKVSASGKSIKSIEKYQGNGTTTLYYNDCGVFEGVKTIDDFKPFGTTHTITLPETIYGGSLECVEGQGVSEWVNIASYAGETIEEPWLCSEAPFVSGTTPPTGSQVVYKTSTPTAITTSGANIPTLSGVNNIYTDCGDIQSLEYFNENGDDIADLVRLMTRT